MDGKKDLGSPRGGERRAVGGGGYIGDFGNNNEGQFLVKGQLAAECGMLRWEEHIDGLERAVDDSRA